MADSANWRFGVAGNIVGKHTDTDGNVYYGTKAFTPGTKVYLDGKCWSNNRDDISVIGRNRFGRTVVECVNVNLIENVRTQRIFNPQVLDILSHLEAMDGWAWWGKKSCDRKETKQFVKDWESIRNTIAESHFREKCLKDNNTIELLSLFSYKFCDYNRCRELIKEIGSVTCIIANEDDFETTPLHAAIDNEHYDFALELINEPSANLDVKTDDQAPIIWDLQYLWVGGEVERHYESIKKGEILREMIKNGANPNPVVDGEPLLNYLRFKINADEDDSWHLIRMEHTIDAHANGVTDYFFEKIRQTAIKAIFVSKYNIYYVDKNQCWSDHAIFELCDGEKFLFSSYTADSCNGKFYATNFIFNDLSRYEKIMPNEGVIMLNEKQMRGSDYVELLIDDAILLVHAEDNNIEIGITSKTEGGWDAQKRKHLFD